MKIKPNNWLHNNEDTLKEQRIWRTTAYWLKTKAHKMHLQNCLLENWETERLLEANKDKNSANTPLNNWNEEKQRKSCLTLFWLAGAIAEAFCLMAGRTTCLDCHTKELTGSLCLAPLSPSLGASVLAVVVALTGMAATFCDLATGLMVNLPLGWNWGSVLLGVDVTAKAPVLWEELENWSWPIGRFDRVLPAMSVGIFPNLPKSVSFMLRTIASYCDLVTTIVLVGFLPIAAATVGFAKPGFWAATVAVGADWTVLASDVDFNSRFESESNLALIWSSDRPQKRKQHSSFTHISNFVWIPTVKNDVMQKLKQLNKPRSLKNNKQYSILLETNHP